MITVTDPLALYLRLSTSLEQFGKLEADLTSSEQEKLESSIATQLQLHKAIVSSTQAAKVGVSGKQIERAISELKNRFPDYDAFLTTLENHALTEKTLKTALRDTLHRENILDHVALNIPPLSDEQAEAYYFKNLKKFEQPERRLTSHILITINDEFEENQRPAALNRIQEIRSDANEISFPQLAMRHSECPTAMNNGKLGLVEKNQLHSELDNVLFSMEENSISQPIESEVGYHILWCEKIEPKHRVPFGQAKAHILKQHHSRAVTNAKKSWIKELLKEGVV